MAFVTTSAKADTQIGALSELEMLWETDFGDLREVALRIVGISAGGLLYGIYTDSLLGFAWAASYFVLLLASFIVLRHRRTPTPSRVAQGYVLFCLSVSIYLSLPIYAMISGDPLQIFCGSMALIAYAVFTLFRPEPPGVLQYIDLSVAWVIAGAAALAFIPVADSLQNKIFMGFFCAIMAIYYALSLVATRAARADLRQAAERSLEAQKMEAIGRLSGGIAHDFNNILTVMQGSLELYHEVPEGKERDALVEDARAAGLRATALVAQLLAFARRAPLDARALDAREIVDDLCNLSRRLLPVSVQLTHRVPDVPAFVMADGNGLHSALLNLILNANDAMEGRGAITIAVDLVEGPATAASTTPATQQKNAHLRFSVADDGPGMDPDVERHALEPFFTTKPVGKGSGLGLSMALGFAEQSGGALRIKTEPGNTTVALHLPLVTHI